MKRRNFLKGMAAAPLLASGGAFPVQKGVLVNDVHTGLNPTGVASIARPTSAAEVQSLVKDCGKHSRAISVSGSRHAASGQQFATKSVLLDTRAMNRIIGLDGKRCVRRFWAG